jgi:hypothetical protein
VKIVPDTHLAISDFQPDTLIAMWIENLFRSALGLDRFLTQQGLTKREWHHPAYRVVGLACPRCGATQTTADDAWVMRLTAGTFPAAPGGLRCLACNRTTQLPALIEAVAPTRAEKKKILEAIRNHRPELRRFYVCEIDDERAVHTDAEQAVMAILPPVHNCRAKMVGIYAPTKEIATQISGQCHSDLPWHEEVELHKNGSLVSIDWHRGTLTEMEKTRQTAREQHIKFAKINAIDEAVTEFRQLKTAELGL